MWLNDLLRAAEGVGGTRITAITVEYNSVDASGVDVPLGRRVDVARRQS